MEPISMTTATIIASLIGAGTSGAGMFMQSAANKKANNLARQDWEAEMDETKKTNERSYTLGKERNRIDAANSQASIAVSRHDMFNKMVDRSFEMKYMLANGLYGSRR
jgi:hypothetical protein